MANTTFANLKKSCLRKAGNWYTASDSTLLEVAGGLINDCISTIQALSPDSLYWRDLDNTVSTTASQAYVDLSETDILQILNVYQRESDTKLTRVDRRTFVGLSPDTTAHSGTPDLAYDEEQILNVSGQNIFRLYLLPTPGSAITIRYDYIKNGRFTADGTAADSEFCALPSTFDPLIAAMFKPRFLEVLSPQDTGAITKAENAESEAISRFLPLLTSKIDESWQVGSFRYARNRKPFTVSATPTPS